MNLPPLAGDPTRQAMAALRGYLYQIWRSVDTWLQLASANEVIYLEVAEDIDWVSATGSVAGQVKHESQNISLNNARAQRAISNFWALAEREPARTVQFHYLTTASAADEQDGDFEGMSGIEFWRVAQRDALAARKLQQYLSQKITSVDSLGSFLVRASVDDFQSKLVRRFHWFVDQPGLEEIKQSVEHRLVVLLRDRRLATAQLQAIRDRLLGFVCEKVVANQPTERHLNLAELIQQIESVLTVHLPVTASQLSSLLRSIETTSFDPARSLVLASALPVPEAPHPLLSREHLVVEVTRLVRARTTVLLTGGVYRGKSTLAQLVASRDCPNALWFSVASQCGMELAKLLHALAAFVDGDQSPSMVVVDDLDVSPHEYRAYRASLALLVGRAHRKGVAILLTASGSTALTGQLTEITGLSILEVPGMDGEEITAHCKRLGCPDEMAMPWARMVHGLTFGHPKLIQVRLQALAEQGWKIQDASTLISEPAGSVNARSVAQRLLADTVSQTVAAFAYTAAEASTPLSRQMLLRLMQEVGVEGVGGDVINRLSGKWLEATSPGRWRITPLLRGSAHEMWLPDRKKLAHVQLFDSIASAGAIDISDAAALIVHAFLAEDGRRLFSCVQSLEQIHDQDIAGAVLQRLMWLAFIALEPGQRIFSSQPVVSAFLRQLQFKVAQAIDSESLAAVADRWQEEMSAIEPTQVRSAMQVHLSATLIASQNRKVVPRVVLGAISMLSRVNGSLAQSATHMLRTAISQSDRSYTIFPPELPDVEVLFALRSGGVRSLEEFDSVLDWLEAEPDEDVLRAFDASLNLPLAQSLGAYVHGAWANSASNSKEWNPTLARLKRANALARKLCLRQFGREAAKAQAIVLCEYLNDSSRALSILEEAETTFGSATTLLEQRVNVRFQQGDHLGVLTAWKPLADDPGIAAQLDAFAYRRAAISALHVGDWASAEQYFLKGAKANPELPMLATRLGLAADAAHAASLQGEHKRAARRLSDLMLDLPEVAFEDGHEDWNSALRAVSTIAGYVGQTAKRRDSSKYQLEYGTASAPGVVSGKSEYSQRLRTQLTVARVAMVASQLGDIDARHRSILEPLANSLIPAVCMHASLALLSLEFSQGPSAEFGRHLVTFVRALETGARVGGNGTINRENANVAPLDLSSYSTEWFSMVAAAAFCAKDVKASLPLWVDAISNGLGVPSTVRDELEQILTGLNLSIEQACILLKDGGGNRGLLVGATIRVLQAGGEPRRVLLLQSLLLSATQAGLLGKQYRDTFDMAIALRFAEPWRDFARSPFLLTSPRTSVPPLLAALDDIHASTGSADQLLAAGARAVGL